MTKKDRDKIILKARNKLISVLMENVDAELLRFLAEFLTKFQKEQKKQMSEIK